MKIKEGEKVCKCCKQIKKIEDFPIPYYKPGWKTVFCWDCVTKNMRKYSATSLQDVTDVKKIKAKD